MEEYKNTGIKSYRQFSITPIGEYQLVNRQLANVLRNIASWRTCQQDLFYLLANFILAIRQIGECPQEHRQLANTTIGFILFIGEFRSSNSPILLEMIYK